MDSCGCKVDRNGGGVRGGRWVMGWGLGGEGEGGGEGHVDAVDGSVSQLFIGRYLRHIRGSRRARCRAQGPLVHPRAP